ncbi:hypothetical protein TorRG33x02_259280 [Trema orientale]|uniref:RNase H type-1 domain-containing protein n=1 Tax=Trema orientale TaxID=63057 RepID=A0A2P5D8A2_TREOI|nr:hypothetical protein TorRG33x02_259280 [Trema orientale]
MAINGHLQFFTVLRCTNDIVTCKTLHEIREVLWSMAPLKAPGPDGMPVKFYKDYWDIIGTDVVLSCFLIGDGLSTNLWNSPWVPWLSHEETRATFNPIEMDDNVCAASLLANDNVGWDLAKVERLLRPEQASVVSFSGPIDSSQREEFILFAAVLSDRIWKARNNAFHSGSKVDSVSLLCQVNEAVGEFLRIPMAPTPISISGGILPYHDRSVLISSPHRVQVWVDAAFKAVTTMVALVARDSRNNILLLAAKQVHTSTALEAELLAVEFRICSCLQKGWMDAILFSDSQQVAMALSQCLAP